MARLLRWIVCGVLLIALGGCGGDNIEDLLNEAPGGGAAYTIGNTSAPSSTQGEGAGNLFAQGPYTVGTATNLLSLHVSIGSIISAGKLQMGLYADTGGGDPGTLVVSAPSQTVFAGLNTVNVGPLPLAPGDYWLAAEYDGQLSTNVSGGVTADNRYGTHTFGSAWPANYPVVIPTINNPTVIYMTVAD